MKKSTKQKSSNYRGAEDKCLLIPRGNEYRPYILIQDVPSLGRSSRPCGIKTGRQHDFLSDLERNYYIILEFMDSVV